MINLVFDPRCLSTCHISWVVSCQVGLSAMVSALGSLKAPWVQTSKWDGEFQSFMFEKIVYVYMYICIYYMYIVYFIGKDSKNGLLSKKNPGSCFLSAFFCFLFWRSLSNFQFQYPGSISHSEVHTTAKSSSRASKDGVSLLALWPPWLESDDMTSRPFSVGRSRAQNMLNMALATQDEWEEFSQFLGWHMIFTRFFHIFFWTLHVRHY